MISALKLNETHFVDILLEFLKKFNFYKKKLLSEYQYEILVLFYSGTKKMKMV